MLTLILCVEAGTLVVLVACCAVLRHQYRRDHAVGRLAGQLPTRTPGEPR